MLDQQQLNEWLKKLTLTAQAENLIRKIRSLPPARRVRGGAGNVCGRYPSRKMGVTIQFESYRQESAAIFELEHDSSVWEYYDQPSAIKLNYRGKNGRRIGVTTVQVVSILIHSIFFASLRSESPVVSRTFKELEEGRLGSFRFG